MFFCAIMVLQTRAVLMLTILGNFVNFYFERKKFKINSNYVSELEKNYERFCVLKFVL